MSQDGTNQEDLQKREQELRERELALRIRELEAELQDKEKTQDPAAAVSSNESPPAKRSKKRSPLIQAINLIGFFLLGLAVVILTLRYRFLIIFFLILAFLGFVAYKLFWEKPQ
jgi:F0F1-type ATP synthase assembly protein I